MNETRTSTLHTRRKTRKMAEDKGHQLGRFVARPSIFPFGFHAAWCERCHTAVFANANGKSEMPSKSCAELTY